MREKRAELLQLTAVAGITDWLDPAIAAADLYGNRAEALLYRRDRAMLLEYIGWKDVHSAMRYLDGNDPYAQARIERGPADTLPVITSTTSLPMRSFCSTYAHKLSQQHPVCVDCDCSSALTEVIGPPLTRIHDGA